MRLVKEQRAVALLIVLIVFVFSTAIILTMSEIKRNELKIGQTQSDSERALRVAEAGADWAATYLATLMNMDATISSTNSFTDQTPLGANKGNCDVSWEYIGTDTSTDNRYRITSVGQYNDYKRTIEETVLLQDVLEKFFLASWGDQILTLRGFIPGITYADNDVEIYNDSNSLITLIANIFQVVNEIAVTSGHKINNQYVHQIIHDKVKVARYIPPPTPNMSSYYNQADSDKRYTGDTVLNSNSGGNWNGNLNGKTIYVDGDLTLIGPLYGGGTIVATGDINLGSSSGDFTYYNKNNADPRERFDLIAGDSLKGPDYFYIRYTSSSDTGKLLKFHGIWYAGNDIDLNVKSRITVSLLGVSIDFPRSVDMSGKIMTKNAGYFKAIMIWSVATSSSLDTSFFTSSGMRQALVVAWREVR